jgi:hypothetical protein
VLSLFAEQQNDLPIFNDDALYIITPATDQNDHLKSFQKAFGHMFDVAEAKGTETGFAFRQRTFPWRRIFVDVMQSTTR